jgi:nitroimidazol reductase NimA-like FMN-containing flavoprotein (pyridoxamine 5'-phosphate oxidase superfamily)
LRRLGADAADMTASPIAPLRRLLAVQHTAVTNARRAVAEIGHGRRDRVSLTPGRRPRDPGPWLDAMTEEECWASLATEKIGRIAFTAHSGTPVVVPVNFLAREGTVVMRTGRGPKLQAAVRHDVGCFEVDRFDEDARTGWSVVVTGPLRLVSAPEERVRLDTLGLQPWAGGPRTEFIVLEPHVVSGRRLVQP